MNDAAKLAIALEALQDISSPIDKLRRQAFADGGYLDVVPAMALTKDPNYLQNIARKAIEEMKDQISPVAPEMVPGLSHFADVLESGEPIEDHFNVRKVPISRAQFEVMDRSQLIALLRKVRSAVDGSEDATDSCLAICELLGVDPSTNV